ncbi:hypothetical protein KAJ87_01320 [Candidatus Pacearchaeota archaeon]|nr:hypothetical protein [Candidatus Pacearchaeota archaeon]
MNKKYKIEYDKLKNCGSGALVRKKISGDTSMGKYLGIVIKIDKENVLKESYFKKNKELSPEQVKEICLDAFKTHYKWLTTSDKYDVPNIPGTLESFITKVG